MNTKKELINNMEILVEMTVTNIVVMILITPSQKRS